MPTNYGAKRAINELRAIFACQWRNGMLPQIRFMPGQHGYRPDADDWGVPPDISGPTALRTSGITQPPIMGMCAYEVFRKLDEETQQAHAPDFLAMAEGLDRYHSWLFRERDPLSENLVLCLHPWETGTDNSPAFDPLIESTRAYIKHQGIAVNSFGRADTTHVKGEHRPTDRDYFAYFGLLSLFKEHRYDQRAIIEDSPFLLQDILLNTLLAVSLQSLASLQQALSELSGIRDQGSGIGSNQIQARATLAENAAHNRTKAVEVVSAIRRKLWSESDGLFYSYDSRGQNLLTTPTVSSLTPLVGEVASPEQAARLIEHLGNPAEFWTETPVPSTSAASPSFNPLRYWSGPTWPVTNWLIIKGLRERTSPLAEQLRLSTLKMIAEGAAQDIARKCAMQLLEFNSADEDFTTPSRKQYQHAWLWDSAIVALSWPSVTHKPQPYDPHATAPQFWEYYHPSTGEPLGAPQMSWTASLLIELQDMA